MTSSVLTSALQDPAPGALIELYQLQLNTAQHGVNETYYFHAGLSELQQPIVWQGQEYIPLPIEADGFEWNGQGSLPRPTLRVSNIFGTITALISTLPNGLEGAKVTRIRTLGRFLDAVNFAQQTDAVLTEDESNLLLEDGSRFLLEPVNPLADPTAEWPREIYYIDRKSAENREVVEFELRSAFDLTGIRAPKRQCISRCQWEYRKSGCGYSGSAYYSADDVPVANLADDVCGKRLSSCKSRFDFITRTGAATTGSNQLVLNQGIEGIIGEPVSGHGIVPGTIALSVSTNGLIVTLSQAASASTTTSKTGTIQANRTQVVLADTNGLAVGMSVSGAGLESGAGVTAISGNVVTLNQPANPNVSLAATKTGTIMAQRLFEQIGNFIALNTAGLLVGMRVMGPGLPADYSVTITSVSTGNGVYISYSAPTGTSAAFSFYNVNPYVSTVFTFSGDRTYGFRNPDATLPFGGYPGIGSFFV